MFSARKLIHCRSPGPTTSRFRAGNRWPLMTHAAVMRSKSTNRTLPLRISPSPAQRRAESEASAQHTRRAPREKSWRSSCSTRSTESTALTTRMTSAPRSALVPTRPMELSAASMLRPGNGVGAVPCKAGEASKIGELYHDWRFGPCGLAIRGAPRARLGIICRRRQRRPAFDHRRERNTRLPKALIARHAVSRACDASEKRKISVRRRQRSAVMTRSEGRSNMCEQEASSMLRMMIAVANAAPSNFGAPYRHHLTNLLYRHHPTLSRQLTD